MIALELHFDDCEIAELQMQRTRNYVLHVANGDARA